MPYSRKIFSLACFFIALTVLVNGCATHEPEHATNSNASHGEKAHWGYEGAEGPEAWGKLKPEFAPCSEGKSQSPIDIADASAQDLANIAFSYQPASLDIVNNGHTIQVNYAEGSSIEVDGATYALKQFHFHGPSEHTMKGKHSPLEIHLVHQNASGGLAVVGVMIDSGSGNQALAPVWANLPSESGQERKLEDVKINATDILPDEHLYYRYDGSLTTPPCSEGVKWFVLTKAIEASDEQVAAFNAIIKGNNRPVQPLNRREVRLDSTPK